MPSRASVSADDARELIGLNRWERGIAPCSANQRVCRRMRGRRRLAGFCRWLNAKRSRSSTRRAPGRVRSRGHCVAALSRFHGSCAATPRRGAAKLDCRSPSRSAKRSYSREDRRSPSCPRIFGCASTCTSGFRVRSGSRTGALLLGGGRRDGRGRTSLTVTPGKDCTMIIGPRTSLGLTETEQMAVA